MREKRGERIVLHMGLVEASQERRQQKSQPFLIMSRVASHASRGNPAALVVQKEAPQHV